MKKLLFGLMLFATTALSAQELGIRFGNTAAGSQSNNVAVDGIFAAGEFSRIHADVSFGNGVGVDALWDFLYRPLGGEAFSWYVGVGPSLFIGNKFWLGVSGEIGLEYAFNGVPIVLGIDWRPTFWLLEKTTFEAGGFGLNIRYRFK
ncbi:outer membrane insertion C- signal [Winogradskyella aurantiaca]|uniref:outer membrane insertion C- signal n=1 Tax=Winogradskyella aurantiaca TaxID=2219558 RepID=UPI000E1C5CA3|nr:outer membrane insertion C- signal [Winogradskyella aurantiaca]